MKKLLLILAAVCCFSMISAASNDKPLTLTAHMIADNETPPINSPATADFKATQNADGTFNFTLTFANLRAPALVSHIHFAPRNVNGGVMIFLCGGDSQPACPAVTSGTITGTFGTANVVGPVGQGIAAGDLTSALEAIGDGLSYANLHSTLFPAGEVRGVVHVRHGHGDRDGDNDRDDHDHDRD